MIVILDLLGSLDLLQIGIHAFFYRTLYDLTSFFMVIAIKKKKCRGTAERFLVNFSPPNSENQQPSNSTIQQIIYWLISYFL
jgi:hypothetical protein